MIYVKILGEPCAQGRGRAGAVMTKHGPLLVNGRPIIKVRDPEKSRDWKGAASWAMKEVYRGAPLAGPLSVTIEAVFTCPRSQWRKREPLKRRPHTKRGDIDNLAKAVLDAATGVLWLDDAQVWQLSARKVIGHQGEAPYVAVTVAEREGG